MYRKKIVVNASTVLISGGLYLSNNIIHALIDSDIFELFIICPSRVKYKSCETKNSYLIIVPRWQLRRSFRLLMDNIWLPRLIRKIDPELVLSLTNIPAKTKYKQLFLHDNPFPGHKNIKQFHLSSVSIILHYLRSLIIFKRLIFVDQVIVQSVYHRDIFLNFTKHKINPIILAPLFTPALRKLNKISLGKKMNYTRRILCLSRYYEHKNIEVLVGVGRLIKKQKLPYTIHLTLDPNRQRKIRKILRDIAYYNITDTVINIGKVKHDEVFSIIQQYDAMILPSLLESFSLVFIESWTMRKPLFVSDTESIRSTCRDAAIYFNPHSCEDILMTLIQAFDNPEELEKVIIQGDKRLLELPGSLNYVNLINKANEAGN